MKSIEIKATRRTEIKKSSTKKVRNEGLVPCVLYGGNENIHFTAPVLDFKKLVFTPEVHTVSLNIEGETFDAVMKDIHFHPVTDKLLHIDFMSISPDKEVVMDIPVKITGSAEGVKQGGRLITKVRKLKIKALPANLPDSFTMDVTPLLIGQSIRVSDMHVKGIEFMDSPNNVIVGVRVTRNVEEVPEAGAAAATAAVASPGAATPAPAAPPAK